MDEKLKSLLEEHNSTLSFDGLVNDYEIEYMGSNEPSDIMSFMKRFKNELHSRTLDLFENKLESLKQVYVSYAENKGLDINEAYDDLVALNESWTFRYFVEELENVAFVGSDSTQLVNKLVNNAINVKSVNWQTLGKNKANAHGELILKYYDNTDEGLLNFVQNSGFALESSSQFFVKYARILNLDIKEALDDVMRINNSSISVGFFTNLNKIEKTCFDPKGAIRDALVNAIAPDERSPGNWGVGLTAVAGDVLVKYYEKNHLKLSKFILERGHKLDVSSVVYEKYIENLGEDIKGPLNGILKTKDQFLFQDYIGKLNKIINVRLGTVDKVNVKGVAKSVDAVVSDDKGQSKMNDELPSYADLSESQKVMLNSTNLPKMLSYFVKNESELSKSAINHFESRLFSLSEEYVENAHEKHLNIKKPINDLLKIKDASLMNGFIKEVKINARKTLWGNGGVNNPENIELVNVSVINAINQQLNKYPKWSDEKIDAIGDLYLKHSSANVDGLVKFVLRFKDTLINKPDYFSAMELSNQLTVKHVDTLLRRGALDKSGSKQLKHSIFKRYLAPVTDNDLQTSIDFTGGSISSKATMRDDCVPIDDFKSVLNSSSLSGVVKFIKTFGENYSSRGIEVLNKKASELNAIIVSNVNKGKVDIDKAFVDILKMDDSVITDGFLKGVDDICSLGILSNENNASVYLNKVLDTPKPIINLIHDEINQRIVYKTGGNEFIKDVENIYLKSKYVSTQSLFKFAYSCSDNINHDIEFIEKLTNRTNLKPDHLKLLANNECFGEYGKSVFSNMNEEVNLMSSKFLQGKETGQLELDIGGIGLKAEPKNDIVRQDNGQGFDSGSLLEALDKTNEAEAKAVNKALKEQAVACVNTNNIGVG
jgi:hypothetical protein